MDNILIIRPPKTKREFDLMYDLRWRILRKPWNQPRGSEKDPDESKDLQLIALLDNKIIGTVRYHKINDTVAQVRAMAVEEKYRMKGVARNLMESLHMTAKNQGIKYLVLNARENAIEFYKKLGYVSIGEGPILYDVIKHEKMVKQFKARNSRIKDLFDKLKKEF
ncbi:MAG: GNAT family N-acetyltransferase [Candidatus Helarchaeota archaeon]